MFETVIQTSPIKDSDLYLAKEQVNKSFMTEGDIDVNLESKNKKN